MRVSVDVQQHIPKCREQPSLIEEPCSVAGSEVPSLPASCLYIHGLDLFGYCRDRDCHLYCLYETQDPSLDGGAIICG